MFTIGIAVAAICVFVYWAAIVVMHVNAGVIAARSGISRFAFPIILWTPTNASDHLRGLFGHQYSNLGLLWIPVWAARLGLVVGFLAIITLWFAPLPA